MPTLTSAPLTLTVGEAARALGISRTLAYEAARSGALPCVRIGRRLLVPRTGLDRLLGRPDSGAPPSDGVPPSDEVRPERHLRLDAPSST